MRVHLVNPSDVAFGIGVITPRWLYVLAAATPRSYGDPAIVDETLSQSSPRVFNRVMSWVSEFIRPMYCVAWRLDGLPGNAAPGLCLAVSTRRCIRKRHTSWVAPTPS